MSSAIPSPSPTLSLSQARDAVNRILSEFEDEDIADEFATLREECDGDINLIMSKIVPMIFEIQGHVMERLGFEGNDEGFAAFAEQLKKWESNEEFMELSKKLKGKMKELTSKPMDIDDGNDEENQQGGNDEEEEEEEEDDDNDKENGNTNDNRQEEDGDVIPKKK